MDMQQIFLNIANLLISLVGISLPFLIIYTIYRAIKGIMTHNAKLKQQYQVGERRETEHQEPRNP